MYSLSLPCWASCSFYLEVNRHTQIHAAYTAPNDETTNCVLNVRAQHIHAVTLVGREGIART